MNAFEWFFVFPFAAAGVAFFFPAVSGATLKRLAFAAGLVPLALLLLFPEKWASAAIRLPWFPELGVEFHLAADPLARFFLLLSSILVPVVILASPKGLAQPNFFYALALLLQGLLGGFFLAKDLVLFIILWEAMLLPVYFMIGTWGGENARAAALKFLLYMIAGSVFLVLAALVLFLETKTATGTATFALEALAKTAAASPNALWLFAAFALAFAVKTPLFPFHAWLPDAYAKASTPGSILLAAVLSKAGVFGFLRIAAEFFPQQWAAAAPLLLGLALAGVLYGGFCACVQNDVKRLIAYSSFSHVNFLLVGLFAAHEVAATGALLQALNHAVTIAGLFLAAGWLESRLGTTAFPAQGGLAKFMPRLAWLTLLFVLASVALPGTNNFVGELLVFFGLFQHNRWLAALLAATVILSVVYSLRWMQKVYFEAPGRFEPAWTDLRWKEGAAAIPLVGLIVWIGVYPAPLLGEVPAFKPKGFLPTPVLDAASSPKTPAEVKKEAPSARTNGQPARPGRRK